MSADVITLPQTIRDDAAGRADQRLGRLLQLDEDVQHAALAAMLARPMARDALTCAPLVHKREGQPFRPWVVVQHLGVPVVLFPSDAARRVAVRLDAGGRQGAAHDLIDAADAAETISHNLQRSLI